MNTIIIMRRLNVYFIHAQWLKDRERVVQELRKLLTKYTFNSLKGIKIRVVTQHDPNDINGDTIAKHINYSPIQPTPDQDPQDPKNLTFYNMFLKNLHVFQLSNALKHYSALQDIANDSAEDDINMIIEDDVLYEDKVCMYLERLMDVLPTEHEVVFLGLPSNDQNARDKKDIKMKNTKEVFRVFPYNDAYIVSKTTAAKLVENYLPIKFVTNVQLSYVFDKAGINSQLISPNIFMDGSKFGVFLSTMNTNNQLLFNNEYMFARTVVMNEKSTPEEKNQLEQLFQKSPLNGHPDFLVVKALHKLKQKEYTEAHELYESALKIYTANSCIINHECQFLKEYIGSYKFIQDPNLAKFV